MKTKIGIMKKGDEILFVQENKIAIKRKNGEVDLIPVIIDTDGMLRVDIKNVMTIGYGDNDVQVKDSNDNNACVITTF